MNLSVSCEGPSRSPLMLYTQLTEDAAGDEPATQTKYQWRINWEKESSIFLATSSVASLIEVRPGLYFLCVIVLRCCP